MRLKAGQFPMIAELTHSNHYPETSHLHPEPRKPASSAHCCSLSSDSVLPGDQSLVEGKPQGEKHLSACAHGKLDASGHCLFIAIS